MTGTQRMAVIGAGPLGSVLSAVLITAGHDVTVCEVNEERRKELREKGLVIEGLISNECRIQQLIAHVDELASEPPDFLFLAVKADALPLISSAVRDFSHPDMTVICWLGGIDVEHTVVEALKSGMVVRAVVGYGAVPGPQGQVIVVKDEKNHFVKELHPESLERARAVARLLTAAGLETQRIEDLVGEVWRRNLLEAALQAVGALARGGPESVMADSFARRLALAALREGITVARANEIPLGVDFWDRAMEDMESRERNDAPMLRDLAAGRRTEVDWLNGKILEYGRMSGVRTPVNETLYGLIKAREALTARSQS